MWLLFIGTDIGNLFLIWIVSDQSGKVPFRSSGEIF